MTIKGSKTEQNLLKAFAGESQARNRYTFFAGVAKNEGYAKVAAFFDETARNEEEHAKQFFKHLEGGMLEITASYPAGKFSVTSENLLQAAAGEYEEWAELYPAFANVAREEGFIKVATLFDLITTVERLHEARFRDLHQLLADGTMFKRKEKTVWRCMKCGFEHEGLEAPKICPICSHPQGYFEINNDRY